MVSSAAFLFSVSFLPDSFKKKAIFASIALSRRLLSIVLSFSGTGDVVATLTVAAAIKLAKAT